MKNILSFVVILGAASLASAASQQRVIVVDECRTEINASPTFDAQPSIILKYDAMHECSFYFEPVSQWLNPTDERANVIDIERVDVISVPHAFT